jgi:hypothetical protein
LICPAALSPLHLFSSGHPRNCSYLSRSPGDVLWSSAFCRGRWLFIPPIFLAIFWGSAEANSRQAFCNLAPIWILLANPLRCDRRSFTDGNNNEVARRRDWRCSCLGSGLHDRRDRFHHLLPTRVIGGLMLLAGGSDPIVLGMLIVFSLLPL